VKYSVGDLIVETCFLHKKDWQTGIVMEVQKDILSDIQLVGIMWSNRPSQYLDYYKSDVIDAWVKRNNAIHCPVK